MNKFPHLSKAPIVEGVLDFRVSQRPDFKVETLKLAEAKLPEGYRLIKPQKGYAGHIFFGPDAAPQQAVHDLGITGYVLHSADDRYVAQFRRDGVSLSRLAPYTSWEDVFEKAVSFWRLYVETAAPVEVERIAVRTINRITLIEGVTELAAYLTAPPPLPPGIPTRVRTFLSQNLVEDEETGIRANVIQTIEPPEAMDKRAIILDSDVFLTRKFDPKDDRLLETFESLRKLKNVIFFNSLRPEIIERYK